MWHVSSRSGEATLRTAIHLLLTYLLTVSVYPFRRNANLAVAPYHHRIPEFAVVGHDVMARGWGGAHDLTKSIFDSGDEPKV